MKLSTMEKRLNALLQKNLKRPNKTTTYTREGFPKETKEGLEYAVGCKVWTFMEFKESKTKVYVDENVMCSIISDFLQEAYKPKHTKFTMHHWSRQTWDLINYSADVSEFGFDNKENKFFTGYKYLAKIRLKETNTAFGELPFNLDEVESEKNFKKHGTPKESKIISKIELKEDVDITLALKKRMKKDIKRNKENEKRFAEQRASKERK